MTAPDTTVPRTADAAARRVPRLQIALDTADLPSALRPLMQAAPYVDVVECGTILVLHEGLRAVREIRAVLPEATILADVRIVEAGSLIAEACFAAGADWVSCVAGASMTTIAQVVDVADGYGGQVQVELNDDPDVMAKAPRWRELGVRHVIVKRSRDQEAAGVLAWTEEALGRVAELSALGFTVSVTGGITAATVGELAGRPIDIVIAGREIVKAADPAAAARGFADRLGEVFGQ